jgi:ethanolamine utilization cobalamin adenosyltransferase
MSPEDAIGAFMYGLTLLIIDEHGLVYDQCDESDLQAIGGASILTYRLSAKNETPVECALSRLCVLTGTLLVAPRGPDGARIAKEWRTARNEYSALQISAQS